MLTMLSHTPEYLLYVILGGFIGESLCQVLGHRFSNDEQPFRYGNRGKYLDIIDVATGLSPFVGLLGTVIALMHALETLGSPDKLAPILGAALYTTALGIGTALTGAVLASGIRIHQQRNQTA